jgi:hypothetical protein
MLAAFALLPTLAACGGGEPASTTTSTPALPRSEAAELEESLHTTDLSMRIEADVVVITNKGPNPADDVWLEGIYLDSQRIVPPDCQMIADGFQCKIGVLSARQIVSRELSPAGQSAIDLTVVDRAGTDPVPADNRARTR